MTIADHAMLVRLSISQMGLSRKDAGATLTANQALNTGKNDAGYFRKFRVQRSDVIDITKAAGAARSEHLHYTVPFGDDLWRLLPSDLVLKYTKSMRVHKQCFEDAVEDFINNWQDIIDRNKTILGSIFNADDYPAKHELENFYDFKIEFRPVPQSDHLVLKIEEETLDELKKNMEQQNLEAIDAAKKDLWQRLYRPVKHMAERLDDDTAIFHNTLIGNIEAIVAILPSLNVDGDPQLMQMADEIKDKLCGYSPGQIRKDPVVRRQTANDAKDLADKMSTFMGGQPSD